MTDHEIMLALRRTEWKLGCLALALRREIALQEMTMALLDDLRAAVAAESGQVQAAVALLKNLHDQLVAALAANDPAAIQAVIDQIQADTATITNEVAADQPPAPPAA